jgi:hypothetical protein
VEATNSRTIYYLLKKAKKITWTDRAEALAPFASQNGQLHRLDQSGLLVRSRLVGDLSIGLSGIFPGVVITTCQQKKKNIQTLQGLVMNREVGGLMCCPTSRG